MRESRKQKKKQKQKKQGNSSSEWSLMPQKTKMAGQVTGCKSRFWVVLCDMLIVGVAFKDKNELGGQSPVCWGW